MQITHDIVAKLIMKFKRAGSVADGRRYGRPKTATDEDTPTQVLAAMAKSPTKGPEFSLRKWESPKAVP
ncbi:hypothetical protein AVEN_210817-1 [Araneus ventricosus]|uniref:DUF4817 domain-containing protein n=1 Tax=Araneus ventricosus TaxID=182803 RepID=A0A4Y2CL20_ARAVE|nr:hypothetical protein AVEN_210817-1 [Araneus ventricosus]